MSRLATFFSALMHRARLALLVPFVVMALIAPGVMPHLSGGQITMVLCGSDGAGAVVIDLATGLEVPAVTDDRCDWAAAQVVALIAGDAPDVAWPVALARMERLAGASVWRMAAWPGDVSARAPPFIL